MSASLTKAFRRLLLHIFSSPFPIFSSSCSRHKHNNLFPHPCHSITIINGRIFFSLVSPPPPNLHLLKPLCLSCRQTNEKKPTRHEERRRESIASGDFEEKKSPINIHKNNSFISCCKLKKEKSFLCHKERKICHNFSRICLLDESRAGVRRGREANCVFSCFCEKSCCYWVALLSQRWRWMLLAAAKMQSWFVTELIRNVHSRLLLWITGIYCKIEIHEMQNFEKDGHIVRPSIRFWVHACIRWTI